MPGVLDGAACQRESWAALDVPVQYFQSVITIELAVSGALLWQIRFFESNTARREGEPLPDARLRVGLAVVMGATVFLSLWAMADEGPKWAALAVTIGLAVSLVPILVRVLPPLAKDATTNERDPDYAVTIIGLLLYVVVVAGVLLLLDIE
jgi:phosphatidylserine synthase